MAGKDKKRPCFQCEERKLGCHSTCKDYIEFQKKNQERNEALRKQREADITWR